MRKYNVNLSAKFGRAKISYPIVCEIPDEVPDEHVAEYIYLNAREYISISIDPEPIEV